MIRGAACNMGFVWLATGLWGRANEIASEQCFCVGASAP